MFLSKRLFHNKPFPVNAGPVQVKHMHGRITPAYGLSKVPHIPKEATHPGRDAMGRIIIEDGISRLRAGWPPMHVAHMTLHINADFFFSYNFVDTVKINTFMKNRQMLALCIVSSKKVMMLSNGSLEKALPKLAKGSGLTPAEYNDKRFASFVASMTDGPDCLTKAQYDEVSSRMHTAYIEYGVGFLVMNGNEFIYYVIVPNETEYAKHKVVYDEREMLIKIANDEHHVGSKRTRSGKKFHVV